MAGVGLDTSEDVPVIRRDGVAGTVPRTQLEQALASGEYTLEDPEATAARLLEAEHGGLGGQALTALEGAASTVSFGGSDVALDALGARTGERAQVNPRSRLAGEVAGALVPVGAAGVAGKAGKTVSSALGAERAGASLLRRSLARGAGTALEGSMFGLGQGVSELALTDRELDAEAVLSTLGSHALAGAKVGGLVGSALPVLGAATQSIRGKVASAFQREASAPGAIADDLVGKTPKELRELRRVAEKEARSTAEVGRKPLIDEASKLADEARDLTGGELLGRIKETKGLAGEVIRAREALKKAVALPESIAKNPGRLADALEGYEVKLQQALKGLGKRPGAAGTLDTFIAGADDALERTRLAGSLEGAIENARGLRGRLREAIEAPLTSPRLDAIDDALASRGGLADQASGMVARVGGDLAGGVAAAGAAALGLPGMAIGATARFVGQAAEKLLSGQLGTATRELAQKAISAIDSFSSRAAPLVGARVAPAVAQAARSSYGDAGKRGRPSPEEHRRMVTDIAAAAADPDGYRAKVWEQLTAVRGHDPMLADDIEELAMRRLAFLATIIPPVPQVGTPVDDRKWAPSDAEISRTARYVAAAEDAQRFAVELARGRLTRETVQATKAVYPRYFAAVIEDLHEQMANRPRSLPYAKRMQLDILLGTNFEPTTEPRRVAQLQSNFVTVSQAPPPTGPNPGSPPSPSGLAGEVKAEPTKAQAMSQ